MLLPRTLLWENGGSSSCMSNPDQPSVSGEGTSDTAKTQSASPPASGSPSPQMPGLPDPDAATDDDDGFEALGIEELLKELDSRAPAVQDTSGGLLTGTIVNVRDDGFFVDIGRKSEAFLPREDAVDGDAEAELAVGDEVAVSITGRSSDGYLKLSRVIAERPKDWSQFEAAFEAGTPIAGTVSEVIKGGLAVDVGVRAFLPASRSGVRETADLEKLVGQENPLPHRATRHRGRKRHPRSTRVARGRARTEAPRAHRFARAGNDRLGHGARPA